MPARLNAVRTGIVSTRFLDVFWSGETKGFSS
jgi:hypothetical protein